MLQVRLLGGVAADRDGEQLSLPPPVGRLLALLALRPGAHARETVAATLWPSAAGPAARANLRTAVWALRKVVGDDALVTSRSAVGLRSEAITVDLADGQRRAAAGDVAAAAALCRGEVLPGYAEDWAEAARRRQRAELAETLAALVREQLAMAERMDSAAFAARARHDAGLISLAAGRHLEAARLLEQALADGAEVSPPAARLARAEALARSGRPDEAAAEVRRAALEPVRSSDQPWALVPRMTRVQGLISLARGDRAGARRRLTEAAEGWRRHLGHDPGAEFVANFVDLGRPPIVGLVEPAWELRRLTAELAALDELTEVP